MPIALLVAFDSMSGAGSGCSRAPPPRQAIIGRVPFGHGGRVAQVAADGHLVTPVRSAMSCRG